MNYPLVRVFGSKLAPDKKLYALSSKVCCMKPSRFVSSLFFDTFKEEIAKVKIADLWRENGDHVTDDIFGEKPIEGYIISSFGLLGGFLRFTKPEQMNSQLLKCLSML